jgi:hypothetical protein
MLARRTRLSNRGVLLSVLLSLEVFYPILCTCSHQSTVITFLYAGYAAPGSQ